jgi:hypothetical protein
MKMKKYLLVLLLVLGVAITQAQSVKDNVYIPRIYNAAAGGDSILTDQFVEISNTDTTETVVLAGWNKVFLVLTTKTGTTGGIVVKYQGSTDGVNYGTNLFTLDSLNWTAATAKKSFDLTTKCGGFYSIRLVFIGSTGPAFVGVNYYSAFIRRKP